MVMQQRCTEMQLGQAAKPVSAGLGRVLKACRRDVLSDEVRAVIGPLLPSVNSTGRHPVDRRVVVEAAAWRFRTGGACRNDSGTGTRSTRISTGGQSKTSGAWLLGKVQSLAYQGGDVDWSATIDSTIVCVHTSMTPHCRAPQGRRRPLRSSATNHLNHAIDRSRGRLTAKSHLVCDGKGRPWPSSSPPGRPPTLTCSWPR